jgi:hypothetical protein
MKINKSQLLANLKADLRASETMKKFNDGRISEWRDAYEGKPYGNEQKGRSSIVSRDIRRQIEWQLPSLVDPFVSSQDIIKCTPVTFEDVPAAIQNQLLLNTQFCRKFPRFNFITKGTRILTTEGTLVVQVGWEYEDEEIESEVDTIAIDQFGQESIVKSRIKEVRVVKNQPTARICRNEDIYIDPTCMDDIDNIQFIIHRYETDLSTLRKDGRYKNLDRLVKEADFDDTDFETEDITDFKFQDEPRKKLVVYEYWGNYDINDDGIAEPIVCAWVGTTIIRLENSPYPDGRPPFLIVPYNPTPFKIHGEADAELIGDNQKVKTAVIRGIMDNMAQSNNGQVGVRKGALDATNRARFINGRNFEFNGTQNDFWQGSYNSIPGSVFDVLGLMNNETESLTGVKSFSTGITGKSLGVSATAARGALDATQIRRSHIVQNVAENLIKPLMRKWMSYNAVFLSEEEVIRVTNDEYVPISRDDLSGNIDIEIAVSTAEDNAAKAEELSFLLQTVGPSEDPSIRRELMADILELMRMPDKAKRLREFEQEPDPFQEAMQQLEIEKKKADIEMTLAKAEALRKGFITIDSNAALTQAKTELDIARARKVDSETDILDLNFLMQDEDVEGKRKAYELDQKRLHDLDMLAFQAQYGDRNLGVPRK